jgi:hypothetical protein
MRPHPALRVLLVFAASALASCQRDAVDDKGPGDDTPVETDAVATVSIQEPRDGARLNTPDAVRLRGSGTGADNLPLASSALAWESDADGPLGTGAELTVALSAGEHTLTLRAGDASDTVSVTVAADNLAPTPTILAPADGATVLEGTAVTLEGSGDDPEDGALPSDALLWTSDLDGALGSGASLVVPTLSLGSHTLTLTALDRQGATGTTAIGLTVAPVGANLPPTVTITAPMPGASLLTGGQTLSGSATDPEDGPLTGPALSWGSSRDGALGAGESLSVDLSAGAHTLTLTATDGDGLSASANVAVTVNPPGNSAPTAIITAPMTGASRSAAATLSLTGTGTDPEDGTLTGSSLSWASDLDGALGTGSPLDVTGLSVGRHRIQLTATDTAGAVGIDSIDVFITAPNQPPTVTITAPPVGTSVTAGTPLTLTGSASDPEDGALTGSALTWRSNLDGLLGTGASLTTSSLTAGTHQLTLTAVDSGGLTGSASRSAQVTPAPANLPPIARLTVAPAVSTGVSVTLDGSSSADADGTIVRWTFDPGDGSATLSGTSPARDHTYAADGAYTVTLTVEDDDGATATATAAVTATTPPRVPEVAAAGPWPWGRDCSIAVDAADRAHVIGVDTGYEQLWYAAESGSGWSLELVDGPGFQVGDPAASHVALTLDPAGVPHAAWIAAGALRYASRAGGVWQVTEIDDDVDTSFPVAIAIDPTRGEPVIAYTDDPFREIPAVATRSGGTWSTAAWTAAVGNYQWGFRGGLVIAPNGTAHLVVHEDRVDVLTWSFAAGFGNPATAFVGTSNVSERAPLVARPNGDLVVLHRDGISAVSGPTTWDLSQISNGTLRQLGLAWDPVADAPVVAFRNNQGNLEIVRPNGNGYWTWDYQGPVDATPLDLAVDSAGEARACFYRDGALLVY